MPLLGRLKGLVCRRHGDPFRFWAKHLPFHTAGISFTDSHLFEKYHFCSAVNCRVNLSFRNLEVSLKKYELEDSPRIHLPKTLIPQVNFYASPPSLLPPTQACWGRYKDGVYWKYSNTFNDEGAHSPGQSQLCWVWFGNPGEAGLLPELVPAAIVMG